MVGGVNANYYGGNQVAANAGASAPAVPTTPAVPTATEEREQLSHSAMNAFQARYGEKPKEQRQIKKSLDKDDFMRIMITEMKHQDPTKPMDSDRMVAQMSQLTSVEQIKNMGEAVNRLVDKNTASDRLAMSAMIGKSVTVDKGRFVHSKGAFSALNYQLPQDAAKVKVTVLDEQGEEVFTKELEPQKKGSQVFNWDGIATNGVAVKSGNYSVRVDAENEKGSKIKIDPISQEHIVGVSFDGKESYFLVGQPQQPQKVAMSNVIRIESGAAPKSASSQAASSEVEDGQAHFQLPGELQEKLKTQLAQHQQAAKPNSATETNQAAEPVAAEGFPNGLKGGD